MHETSIPIRRRRSARPAVAVALVVACGSAAWADAPILEPLDDSSETPQVSPAMLRALSVRPRRERADTAKLRIGLIREKREARREALRRRRLARERAAEAAAAEAAAAEAVAAEAASVETADAAPSGQPDWYAIAECESGGAWSTNTGNGYWGGLQFAPSTWRAYGGGSFDGEGPFPYSAAEQIAVAERVYASQGPEAWPNCFRWA